VKIVISLYILLLVGCATKGNNGYDIKWYWDEQMRSINASNIGTNVSINTPVGTFPLPSYRLGDNEYKKFLNNQSKEIQ
jgi:hypothetical protein